MAATDTTTPRRSQRRRERAAQQQQRPPAISVRNLTKVFGNGFMAVDNISFDVGAGKVVGFIGPNGAGKSTTFRMLMGLIRPTGGEGTVLGHSIREPHKYLPKVGSLIEQPALYLNLTGPQNLKVMARLGGFDESRIPDLIELAGVDADLKAKVAAYSLGNKQRLAIAAALLGDPELLILDEPANGLDPLGTRDLRRFLRNLTSEGKTVFLSSHLLGELEMVSDDIVMIQGGKLMYDGPLEELTHGSTRLVAVAEDREDHEVIVEIAEEAGYDASAHSGKVWIEATRDFAGELNRLCMDEGITLVELGEHRKDLESLFIEMATEAKRGR